jgi:hypothetical protein
MQCRWRTGLDTECFLGWRRCRCCRWGSRPLRRRNESRSTREPGSRSRCRVAAQRSRYLSRAPLTLSSTSRKIRAAAHTPCYTAPLSGRALARVATGTSSRREPTPTASPTSTRQTTPRLSLIPRRSPGRDHHGGRLHAARHLPPHPERQRRANRDVVKRRGRVPVSKSRQTSVAPEQQSIIEGRGSSLGSPAFAVRESSEKGSAHHSSRPDSALASFTCPPGPRIALRRALETSTPRF